MTRAWRQLRPLYGDRLGSVAALVAASVMAGIAEATVLTLLANVASAIVVQAHRLQNDLGPLGLRLGIRSALLITLAVALVRLLLGLVIAWLPASIAAEVQSRWRRELFGAFSSASWSVQSRDREGHLQELMTNQIAQAMQAVLQVVSALSGGAMFLALVAAAFALNPLAALIILITAAALFWALRPISKYGRRAARDLSQASINHATGISEVVRLGEESHVFGAARANRRRVGGLIDTARNAFFRYQFSLSLIINVYQSLVMLLIVLALAGLYITGAGNIAALGAIVLMLVRATSYAQQCQSGLQAVNQVMPYVERIQSATARYRASVPASGNRAMPAIVSVAFKGVAFTYSRDRPALRGVSFAVEAGEAVGIVGPSGAGKSTLIQLLLRLREPDSGSYLLNGQPASSFARRDWQRKVSYVAQEPRVMRATVADNIRFFRDLDDATIERAARLAHIHDEIMDLPAGYDTVIGQLADAVSGGQRQRICIARALAADPDILVLDEPTSALDMFSEVAVQASLSDLHGRVTLFIAAHRLSTLKSCDRVLVLADGAVENFAPASELEHSNAFYQMTSTLAGGPR